MSLPNQAGVMQGATQPQATEVPQMPPQQPLPEVEEAPQEESLYSIISQINLAENLKENDLIKIGQECKRGFENDLASRKQWEEEIKDWVKLATQCKDIRNFPWNNASNVKFPLMGIAAMQFSARAYPSLVPSNGQIVATQVYGKDPNNEKEARAKRVRTFMSWQILHDMEGWEEGMDRLLMQVGVTGNMYKKTYFDPETNKNCSKVIGIDNLVVNYWAKDFCTAERISEIILLYKRQIKERQREGLYIDVDLGTPIGPEGTTDMSDEKVMPFEIIEQHTWLELPKDKFEKPYIVTFEKNSGKVLRITARFDLRRVRFKNEKPTYIPPKQYYTKFGFIPNPDGSFYDLGFGHLLGPLNESVNTLVNQLIDSGTLNNLQSGFVGKGLRIKGGDYSFTPGEWKWVNATGDDIKKQIMPLPTKEPSATLMKLLEYLVGAGKELASIAEIFVGKMPGQNTPATTTTASIEQGMKVFTAIYKRVYRSLTEEFQKLFELNADYLDPHTISKVLDESIGPGDFDTEEFDIYPAADPSASSQQERLAKAQALLQLIPMGTIDPGQVTVRILDAMEIPNYEQLIPGMAQSGQPQIPQKPDPKMMEMQMKMEAEQKKAEIQGSLAERKLQLEAASKEAELKMKAEEHRINLQAQAQKVQLQAKADEHKQKIFMAQTAQQMQAKQAQAQQGMVQSEQKHQQQQRHAEEKSKLQSQKAQSSTGGKNQSRK